MTDLHDRISIAMSARFADREAPVHVEEQIYTGFYSSADQRLLDQFQIASWEERPAILDQITDQRARQLGRRLLYLHRSDLLDATVLDAMTSAVRDRWNSDDPDAPWMTFAEVEKKLAEIEEAKALAPEDLGELQRFYQGLRSV
jgi:exodeoxyribonuclease-1